MQDEPSGVRRRDLLSLIGAMAGSAAMYHAMTSLGFASESRYQGPIKLEGDAKGASVLILGAGLAGMTAALELRNAGYKVQLLEYNCAPRRPQLDPARRRQFYRARRLHPDMRVRGQGSTSIPARGGFPIITAPLLDYCRRLNVALEPFIQLNHNAYLHAARAFDGTPQRIRDVKADFQGQVAELLAKSTQQGRLDEAVTKEDQEILLQALRSWGALDSNYNYKANLISAEYSRLRHAPGGGLTAMAVPSEPVALGDILKSRVWRYLQNFANYNFQTTMFQPVGGMDMIGKAFAREVGGLIRYNAKVTGIEQNDRGVTVSYVDTANAGETQTAKADWCVCTIPLSILSQIPLEVGATMKSAIDAVPYAGAVKIGLQFKRRFWEEDEAIYGGISYTDLPIRQIAYPNTAFNRSGRGVLLGAYLFDGANAYEFTAMPPEERVARAVEFGAAHPSAIQARIREWRRGGVAPRALHARLQRRLDRGRAHEHYNNLCQIDGRIVLAGEHASYIPAWQEGAILSALDAIGRLHQRVVRM